MSLILSTEHPSENEVVFRLASPLPADLCQDFADRDAAAGNELARALFLIMGIRKIQIAGEAVTLARDPGTIWPLIIPPAINILNARVKKLKREVA